MTFKFVVSSPKEKKAYQVEKDVPTMIGMEIGQSFDGSMLGLNGHTLKITGGSDKEGFGMRKDLPGTGRRRLVVAESPGYHPKVQGIRRKKSIRGNTISDRIIQINVVVEKSEKGAKKIADVLAKPPEEKEEKEE